MTDQENTVSKKKNRAGIIIIVCIIAVIAALIMVIAAVTRTISENRSYDRYVNSAQMSIQTGDYDSALASLRKAASIDCSDDCLLLMAQCYDAQNNYDKAIEALRSMKTGGSAVSAKIAELEQKKESLANEGTIDIAGNAYSISATELVLDGKNLTNADMADVASIYALNNLSLAGNSISDISPLASLGGLTTLNLNGNAITDLSPLSGLANLRTLYLDNNPISDLSPLYSLSSLTNLSIKGIEISADELNNLSNALPYCAINGANAKDDKQVIALAGITFDVTVRELDLSYKGLTDISALSACKSLATVNLAGNYISDITPLMDISTLQDVNISSNSITDLRPFMGLSNIKTLNASNNMISTTVPLGAVTSISTLDLSNNSINDFSGLRKMKNLSNLNLSGTGFHDGCIDYFQYLSKLTRVNLENNSGFTGTGYERLQKMLPACAIDHSSLVYSYNLDGNEIQSNATVLDMQNMGITELSALLQISSLETVCLAGNNISNLYYFELSESRNTITYLDLSDNDISDLTPLAQLRSVTVLNLSDNNITNLQPLYGLTTLREVYLGGNPLADYQIAEINSYLPQCTVVFR